MPDPPIAPPIADLELRILAREARGYPVELTLEMAQEFPRGFLDPARLPDAALPPDERGRALCEWLLSDPPINAAWAEIHGRCPRRRVRLRIDEGAPELHALPWELLREVQGGVPRDLAASAETPLSRYLAVASRPGEPVIARPVRVLVAVADPAGLADYGAPLDREDELARLRRALGAGEGEGEGAVELTLLDGPCDLGRLAGRLREGFHVLHFVGHGAIVRGAAHLLLADEQDGARVRLVPEEEIAGRLASVLPGTALRLVVLLSCQTAARDPGDAFRGLAPRLVQAGVPAVVAMQDFIAHDAAHAFLATFYPRLLDHGLVDLAVNEARAALAGGRAIATAGRLPARAIPTLFMRLREGRLLGTRGTLGAAAERSFWPFLLENIAKGRCVPFLGPRLADGLLPDDAAVAARLAARFEYPLDDGRDLLRVAQYIQLHDPGALRASYREALARGLYERLGRRPSPDEEAALDATPLPALVERLGWAEAAAAARETTVYHQLAELPLPLYISTGHDPLLEAALRLRGREARIVEPRWEAEAGSPQWLIEPPPDRARPVVFHINGVAGDDAQLDHLVLTEDDCFHHLVRLARDQEELLPMNLIKPLSQSGFLFLGYDVTDWSFRVLLQGLLRPLTHTGKRMFVGVQLAIDDEERRERARDYLRGYLGQYNIEIYWGTTQQLVADLVDRFRRMRPRGAG